MQEGDMWSKEDSSSRGTILLGLKLRNIEKLPRFASKCTQATFA